MIADQAVQAPVAVSASASVATRLDMAAREFAAGRRDDAAALLTELEATHPAMDGHDASQLDFLQGLIAMEAHDYAAAVRHFRRLLVREPKTVRARLEIGRAYFMLGDYGNAERQFLFARAGKLPPTVRKNIDRFLIAIRARKRFSVSVSLTLATDSNRNAGPTTDSVTLYGLPFQLSPSARANGGVGLAVDTTVEWAPPLTGRLKWRMTGQLHRAQYRETALDDMTLTASTGPHYTLQRWGFDLAATVSRRWYADRVFNDTHGVSIDVTRIVTPRLGVEGALGISRLRYPLNPVMDGTGTTASATFLYTLGPDSMIRGGASFTQQSAASEAFAFHARQFSAGYVREFGGGLTLSLAATHSLIVYGAPLAAFGVTRVDRQPSAQIMLLDRRIEWHGLTPRLSYAYVINDSTIPLYRFHRGRFEVSFTRTF
ncbi:MAG: hypothetical protein JWL96_206 [Sphingomonas bacterium]|uniref:surface lipoprotein assembly modifier n=1 Tax=Sphingomonas bacterium TaxID=1895847 RepID=UPI00262CF1B6|nr:surface lipoprotein assembly modifier [Sphingomonas bacterium]MDB5708136.1 hypothetical protein [Sphingomonas bacterium]